ncbi:MAG: multidrug efflux pump subunit AcrB [Candidatus Azotimanducaceae bacterium]|jgi:multidrug efflux pump subunit AcrB
MSDSLSSTLGNIFYRMPRLTFLALGFIIVTGLSSFMNLPREEDPSMTERFGFIETQLSGASAIRMEALVTENIETGLREIPEIKTISSISRAGLSFVSVEFFDSVKKEQVDLIWSEVRDKMSDVEAVLPLGTTSPFVNPSGPVAVTLGIAITSDDTPISILERVAIELRLRLATLPGTKETEIFGEPIQEILVEVDPHAMARLNLSIGAVIRAIEGSDTKIAAGSYQSNNNNLIVEVKNELSSIERISAIPIGQHADGHFLRLSDIANLTKAYVDPAQSLALIHGKRGIVVATTMETGRRVDQWSVQAKKIVEDYRRELPAMIEMETIIDQSHYTDERLSTLVMNLLMAIVLVLLALFVLMGIRSALIIGAALPMTMSMVLTGLYFLEIPLHQMSVTGLIIALGLLIDNAIVIIEEYKHQRIKGKAFDEAIASAVNHLFVPLLASTATTAFAFLPIALTPGGIGDFTGAMAVAVVLSVCASFTLAMTIIPSIAAFIDERFPPSKSSHWWVSGISIPRLTALYTRSVKTVFKHPILGILISLILPICGFLVAGSMTSSFFPPVDRNQFQLQLTLPSSVSLQETANEAKKVQAVIDTVPEIIESHWFIGEASPRVYYNMMGDQNGGVSSYANAFMTTADVDDPRRILPDLQRRLMTEIPGARVMAMPFEQGPPFSAPVEIRVLGPDLNVLKQLGEDIRLILSEVPAVTYSTATLSAVIPQISIYPNENQTRLRGISNQDIPMQLNVGLNGAIAGTVMEGTVEVPVRVRLSGGSRSDLSHLSASPILSSLNSSRNTGYSGVPLEQIASIQLEPSPTRIDRYQNERINTVSGFLLPYAFPSVAVETFREKFATASLVLPEGYRIEFGGEEEQRGDAVSKIIATFLSFLWMMVAVIVLSLNSFRYAGIIGLVGVLSVGLALLGVWLSGYPLGYTALIGTLGLVGLAINGAIIVLSALKASSAAIAGDIETGTVIVVDATRHIVSTTITTIGGFIPLIIFGGHFWPPLAMAIAGGVTGSAILALYLVPAMFSFYAQRDQKKLNRQKNTKKNTASTMELPSPLTAQH